MRKGASMAVLLAGLLAPLTGVVMADQAPMVELTAPRAVGPSESLKLKLTTVALPRNARLTVATEQGEILGAVAPYHLSGSPDTTTRATIPVPASAIVNGRLRLRLEVVEPGSPARSPRPNEIERLDLVVAPRT